MRTLADDFADLRMDRVRSGVHLTVLSLVEPGDVFFVASDPSQVWFRDPDGGYDGYTFTSLAADSWCTQNEIGGPRTRVIVLHNTSEKMPEKLAGGAGGD